MLNCQASLLIDSYLIVKGVLLAVQRCHIFIYFTLKPFDIYLAHSGKAHTYCFSFIIFFIQHLDFNGNENKDYFLYTWQAKNVLINFCFILFLFTNICPILYLKNIYYAVLFKMKNDFWWNRNMSSRNQQL